MASVSSLPPSVPTIARNMDWGRSSDRGAAFRGFSKGRGGARGGSRGRGGRTSGRGDASSVHGELTSGSSTHTPDSKAGSKDLSRTPMPIPSDASSAKSTASTLPQSSPGTDTSTRSRAGSRRNTHQSTRKGPTMTVTPAPPEVVASKVSQEAAKSSNRKRRSHQTSKGSSDFVHTLTVDSALKIRKVHSGPVSPTEGSKDAPPHLVTKSAGPAVTSFGSRTNIDSLVEHVRSMAMERPSTPGSHIDWAGDDDDSLPDLDDWGVKSTTASASNDEASSIDDATAASKLALMSPILDDSIKQLPEHLKSPTFSTASLSPRIYPHPFDDLTGSRTAPSAEIVPLLPSTTLDTLQPSTVDSTSAPPDSTSTTPPDIVEAKEAHHDDALPTSTPLDSSLPANPTNPETAKLAFTQHPPPPLTSLSSNPEPSPHPHPQSAPPLRGLADSIHAPARLPMSAQPDWNRVENGLEASIHAPGKFDPVGPLAPHTAPAGPGFHPSHGRSRTVGRPPFAAGTAGMPYRPFHSGVSTPNGALPNHNRTQSTPPSAGETRHARHASRPVITGDAITRLARTLGNVAPKREAVATASD